MPNHRKHIRFEAEENTFILARGESDIVHSGLALSESQGGCSGVFKVNKDFELKKMMLVKVGQLDSIPVEIRWITPLDHEVVKVGFQYLDK